MYKQEVNTLFVPLFFVNTNVFSVVLVQLEQINTFPKSITCCHESGLLHSGYFIAGKTQVLLITVMMADVHLDVRAPRYYACWLTDMAY